MPGLRRAPHRFWLVSLAIAFGLSFAVAPTELVPVARAETFVDIAMTSTPNPNFPSQPVTFSGTITPNPGGGTVTLNQISPAVAHETVPVDPADGTFEFAPITFVHFETSDGSFNVSFSGVPGVYFPSTSNTYFQSSSIIDVAIDASLTPNPSVINDSVDVSATLTPNPGAGVVWVTSPFTSLSEDFPIDTDTGTIDGSLVIDFVGTRNIHFGFIPDEVTNDHRGSATIEHTIDYRYGTTTVLDVAPNPAEPAAAFLLTATVTPIPTGGVVRFSGGGISNVDVPVSLATGVAELSRTANQFPVDAEFTAEFQSHGEYGPSSDSETLRVRKTTGLSLTITPGTATKGETASINLAAHYGGGNGETAASEVTFFRDGVPVGSADVINGHATLTMPVPAIGAYEMTATVPETATNMEAASEPQQLVVQADTVARLTNVKVSRGRFFPVVDNYYDAVTISGRLGETARVQIRAIRVANGAVMRSWSLGTRSAGNFSVKWNGKSNSGSMVPAGSYRIEVRAVDLRDNVKATNVSTVVDLRKLVYKTATITRLGTTRDAQGKAGNGSVTALSDGSLRLNGGTWQGFSTTGAASAGYEFTVPRAVKYKSLKVGAYVTALQHAPPIMNIGAQNFTSCDYATGDWNLDCFDHWSSGGGTLVWVDTTLSTSANRHDRKVRGAITAHGGVVRVYRVRVIVTYGLLQ